MQGVIAQLQQMGKQRTSETYRCTLKGFIQFYYCPLKHVFVSNNTVFGERQAPS